MTIGSLSVTAQTPTENSKTTSVDSTIKSNDFEIKKVSTTNVQQTEVSSNEIAEAVTTAKVSPKPSAPQTVDPDKWQFQVSPYFWLAGLHGTGGIGNRTAQVDESFSDVFDALNFAFMGTFEARKGKFISLTDLEYVSVSQTRRRHPAHCSPLSTQASKPSSSIRRLATDFWKTLRKVHRSTCWGALESGV